MRCVGCPVTGLSPKVDRIPVDVFDQCLRQVDVNFVRTLRLFNYGEPLLHGDLPGIIERIPRQTWRVEEVEISTNAQHVDWRQFEAVLQMGIVTALVVSCDGDGTPEMYERLRPPSKWEKLTEFLIKARELRDRYCPHLQLRTRTIVPDWEQRSRWNDILGPLGWEPEFRHFYNLPDAPTRPSGRDIQPGQGVCFFLEAGNQLYVNSQGIVVPCCAHPNAGFYGDLKIHKFSRIWPGAARLRFITALNTRRDSLRVCRDCEFGPADSPGPTRVALFPDGISELPAASRR